MPGPSDPDEPVYVTRLARTKGAWELLNSTLVTSVAMALQGQPPTSQQHVPNTAWVRGHDGGQVLQRLDKWPLLSTRLVMQSGESEGGLLGDVLRWHGPLSKPGLRMCR